MARVPKNSVIYSEVTIGEAEALTERSAMQIGRLVGGGYISPVARGRYVLINVVSGNLRWIEDSAAARSVATHRGAVADARARLLQLKKSAKEEARLCDVNEALEMLRKAEQAATAILDVVNRTVPRDQDDRKKVAAIVEAARAEIADRFAAAAAKLKNG